MGLIERSRSKKCHFFDGKDGVYYNEKTQEIFACEYTGNSRYRFDTKTYMLEYMLYCEEFPKGKKALILKPKNCIRIGDI